LQGTVGEPYTGNPYVRFDEGALMGRISCSSALYSTVICGTFLLKAILGKLKTVLFYRIPARGTKGAGRIRRPGIQNQKRIRAEDGKGVCGCEIYVR